MYSPFYQKYIKTERKLRNSWFKRCHEQNMMTEKVNAYSFLTANYLEITEYKCLKYHTSNLSILSFCIQLLVEILILDKSIWLHVSYSRIFFCEYSSFREVNLEELPWNFFVELGYFLFYWSPRFTYSIHYLVWLYSLNCLFNIIVPH